MNQSDFIQQIMSQILGMFPGGNLLNMFTPMVSQWISPNSSLANKFVWPNEGETVSMAAVQNLNNVISGSFGSSAGTASNELHLRALDRYNRMLHPGKSDKELRVMSESMANNPMNIPSLLMSQLDPYGANAGIAEASNLAAALQKRTGGPVSLEGARYASEISKAIFGEDGKSGIIKDIVDRPGAYGNMKIADVMHIGQELAYTDSTGFNDNGKFNADRFKKSIRQMSQSLEPWKDVFGTDIPELMRQLEALTGQGLSVQQSSMRASGARMASVMQATGANIQNITAYRDALAEGMKDPTMENRAILGAHSVAADMVMGTANSGRSSMTTEEFQREAGRYYAATATSKFADKYALAYSKWANETTEIGFRATALNRNELYDRAIKAGFSKEAATAFADKNIDASHKEFRAAYDKASSRGLTHEEAVEAATDEVKAATFARKYQEARDSGMSHDQALMAVSGAENNQELEVYRNTRYHLDSIKSGEAARADRKDIIQDVSKRFLEDYVDNEGEYTVGTSKVREGLRKLSGDKLTEFMALEKDSKVKYLRDNKLIDSSTTNEDAYKMVHDMEASYAKGYTAITGKYMSGEQASTAAQRTITEAKNEAKAKEYEKFAEAVRRISDPGGLQSVLDDIEKSKGTLSPTEAIKRYTGGVSILDGIIEAGIFKDGKSMDAKSIRNAANFALNNYSVLNTEYKSIYDDVMNKQDSGARERGMKAMSALGALGQKQLNSMTKESRDKYISELRNRISKAGAKDDITKIAKDTYIDHKMGAVLEEAKQGDTDKKFTKDIDKMRKILDNNVVSSMDELKTLAIKEGISEDVFKQFASASGASDVDGVEPITRLCTVLETLVQSFQTFLKNQPVKGS